MPVTLLATTTASSNEKGSWLDTGFGKYKAQITGFTYDKQRDYYTCPAEKVLPFRHLNKDLDGRLNKYYNNSES